MNPFQLNPLLTSDVAWIGWVTASVFSIALVSVLAWIRYAIDHESHAENLRSGPFRVVRKRTAAHRKHVGEVSPPRARTVPTVRPAAYHPT